MEIYRKETVGGIKVIALRGRMDAAGTSQIEFDFFAFLTGEDVRAVVDLSEVDFISSAGVRLLLKAAKTILSRGGKMAILNPNFETLRSLEEGGAPSVVPVYSYFESVETVLNAKFDNMN
ncbi:MAG: STAS domain-containing protein [Chloroflexi bacterium]|nr:STAS domain-containing protein [Chloroflexota bacterium]MCA2000812.1 STAS domain-containing protein [Chloroflexota bacterium]